LKVLQTHRPGQRECAHLFGNNGAVNVFTTSMLLWLAVRREAPHLGAALYGDALQGYKTLGGYV
jgi:hypothetical protein